MAENFDLIFGQNASQQYAWNDTDYENGWETIGNIPPTAAQFDALQRRNDTKMKVLNDELTPLVNADTADSRQPSTTYNVDDIKYSPLLPTGWYLLCTTGGISSASDLVITSPSVGDTVTDGTVVWTIRKIISSEEIASLQLPTGTIIPTANDVASPGFLLCDGSAVSRITYADLFAAIGTKYGAGNGSTTFNLPDSDFVADKSDYLPAPVVLGSSYAISDGHYYNKELFGKHALSQRTSAGHGVFGYSRSGTIPYGSTVSLGSGAAVDATQSTNIPLYADLSGATATTKVKNQIKYS